MRALLNRIERRNDAMADMQRKIKELRARLGEEPLPEEEEEFTPTFVDRSEQEAGAWYSFYEHTGAGAATQQDAEEYDEDDYQARPSSRRRRSTRAAAQ